MIIDGTGPASMIRFCQDYIKWKHSQLENKGHFGEYLQNADGECCPRRHKTLKILFRVNTGTAEATQLPRNLVTRFQSTISKMTEESGPLLAGTE